MNRLRTFAASVALVALGALTACSGGTAPASGQSAASAPQSAATSQSSASSQSGSAAQSGSASQSGAASAQSAAPAAGGQVTQNADGSVTISHVYGKTTVPANPQKVATVAWANHDVLLALGVKPVGFAAQTWGVEDDSKMLAWTKAKVEELGYTPVLFDETDGPDFAKIAETKPDLILATYSNISKEQYDTLSKIAPTVAYPQYAWGTPWRDLIRINAAAIGKADEGKALIADLDKKIADATASHPEFKEKTAAFFYASPADMSSIGYYTPGDPRTGFLADLGFKVPPSVEAAAKADPTTFFVKLSAEEADKLNDVDVIVMYGTEENLKALQADPLLGTIPAIKRGSVLMVGDNNSFAASLNPNPLSLPAHLTQYVDGLATATAKAK
ncbi:MAG: iron-siderophore ABC transporter substrate-binding protein [Actinomycetaceae bacterium]|nr:iron-siderophore ABC transporter substrate-binding protein [Actinomycetaceae bacterium]